MCSPSVNNSSRNQLGRLGRAEQGKRSKLNVNKSREPEVAIPSDSQSVGDDFVDHDEHDIDQSSSDIERADGLRPDPECHCKRKRTAYMICLLTNQSILL